MPQDNVKSATPRQTETGKQKDDNIDDLGRRSNGEVEDQPTRQTKGTDRPQSEND